MPIDWLDQTRRGVVTVNMVSPQDIDRELGELEGVDLSGSSLTAGYYTDTRTSGKLVVHGGGWVRGSFVRVRYSIPEWEWTRELGTYVVTDDDSERSNGEWVTTLTLQGMLKTLATDVAGGLWVVGPGARGRDVIRDILNARGCKWREDHPSDALVGQAVTLESGKSQLERIFAMTSATGNRIDADGHGTIVLSRYVPPAQRTPSFEISLTGPRGIAHDGLTRSTDWLSMPNRCVVSYNYSESAGGESVQRNISAYAELPSSDPRSIAQRGYVVSSVRSVNELNPPTWQNAYQQAKADLDAGVELVEWQLTTQFLPVWEGDVVSLVVPDGEERYRGARKCLVKSVDLALDSMQMKLTLKETASGDSEG